MSAHQEAGRLPLASSGELANRVSVCQLAKVARTCSKGHNVMRFHVVACGASHCVSAKLPANDEPRCSLKFNRQLIGFSHGRYGLVSMGVFRGYPPCLIAWFVIFARKKGVREIQSALAPKHRINFRSMSSGDIKHKHARQSSEPIIAENFIFCSSLARRKKTYSLPQARDGGGKRRAVKVSPAWPS